MSQISFPKENFIEAESLWAKWKRVWLEQIPRELKLIFHSQEIEGSTAALCYGDLLSSIPSAPLKRGDVVVVRGNKLELLKGFLFCVMHEAIFCPVPESFQSDLFHLEIEDSSLVSSDRHLFYLEESNTKESFRYIGPSPKFLDFLSQRDDFSILLRTSGTESSRLKSKEEKNNFFQDRWVAYTGESILAQLQAHRDYFKNINSKNLNFSTKRVQVLPLYHTFGLILDTLLGLYQHQEMHFFPSASYLLKSNYILRDSILASVPKFIRLLLKNSRKEKNLSSLTLHLGGARISSKLFSLCEKHFKKVHIGYGLTECGPGVLMDGEPILSEILLHPLNKSFLQARSTGLFELWVRSDTLAFWDKRALINGFLPTGDLALELDGKYEIVGRLGKKIKGENGQWIYMDEVASHLEDVLSLSGCYINIVEARESLEKLALEIKIYKEEFSHHLCREIRQQLKAYFDLSKMPIYIEALEEDSIRNRSLQSSSLFCKSDC